MGAFSLPENWIPFLLPACSHHAMVESRGLLWNAICPPHMVIVDFTLKVIDCGAQCLMQKAK
jgi:hypothetical protein